jgi:hypothetical protein
MLVKHTYLQIIVFMTTFGACYHMDLGRDLASLNARREQKVKDLDPLQICRIRYMMLYHVSGGPIWQESALDHMGRRSSRSHR